MIPLCVPDLTGNEASYLQECITSTFVSSVGPFVTRLEQMLSQSTGAGHAFATSAGTTGLHLALVAAGVRPGDLVCMPSFTFIASANAISHCGATPWLFDISPESWTLDPALLAATLAAETERNRDGLIHKASGRRVSAVLPVHTLGLPADMDAIVAIARDYRLRVVADGAAALGATYKGRPVGRLGADFTVLSFNGNKTVTTGGGGAVLGDDAEAMALVRHLGSTARVSPDYTHDRVGYNYRMTNIEAAIGCAQMERLDRFVAAKRRIAAAYDQAFAGLRGVAAFPRPEWAQSACWFAGLLLGEDAPGGGEVRQRLRAANIEARSFWKPMHLQPPYVAAPATPQPVAGDLWQRVITLPCSTNLSEGDLAHVIATVQAIFAQ